MTATARTFEPWPWALAIGLALGIGVSVAFLWIASRQTPDRLHVNAGEALRAHNHVERARREAAVRGWDVALVARRSAGGAEVEIEPITKREPLPADAIVTLRRERPDRTGLDADIPLRREGERWSARVPLPIAGRWRLIARAGDADVFAEREFALEVAP
jgi:nitrogen fixation protein FixH